MIATYIHARLGRLADREELGVGYFGAASSLPASARTPTQLISRRPGEANDDYQYKQVTLTTQFGISKNGKTLRRELG